MLETLAPPQGVRLLDSIADFCRCTGMAESTFGRRAVNDGKFVARLPFYLVGKEISLKDGRVLCRLP